MPAGDIHPADAVYVVDQSRKDRRSALKKALDRAELADLQHIIACPFGCQAADQNRFGYCCHLIGFIDGHTFKEGPVKDKRVTEGVKVQTVAKQDDEHGRRVIRPKEEWVPLEVGDHLVRITTSLRVYRNAPAKSEPKKTEAA
jgi:hypothetical protein